jgi:hypothetical protein
MLVFHFEVFSVVIFTPSEQMARPSISAGEIKILGIKIEKVKRNYQRKTRYVGNKSVSFSCSFI